MTDGSTKGRRARWATIPNAVTLLRLALVAPIAILIVDHAHANLTVVLLAAFGASDWVDGYLARRLDQASRIGEILDPIADRVGIAAIVLALVISGHLHIWTVLLIAVVDVSVMVIYLITHPARAPEVSWLGKIRTAVLMSGITLVALGLLPGLRLVGAAGAVVCTVGALLHYAAGLGYLKSLAQGIGSR
ncbi:CDP-alcohol phosphatidyltransferase family protein [Demetria terragena]|uniref:CDP-alcohol phosphatidyltransferase family protein n=1 Tax=Demetria terragena TaxID=63959 RepID=UPI000366C8FF|nr:CDP-alcohol phosphatidyltransferase family protein [Demetria terragena]